jgi:lactobin A/cerein 7B family class IIb bacteriocin
MENLEFMELNAQELQEVNGGIAPLIIGGLIILGLLLSTEKAY